MRAATGAHEQAGASAVRIGEGAAHVTEQLALEERRRHRAAVDRDERLVAPVGELVHRARDELLAGAGLAGDEHGRIAHRDSLRELERLLDRGDWCPPRRRTDRP